LIAIMKVIPLTLISPSRGERILGRGDCSCEGFYCLLLLIMRYRLFQWSLIKLSLSSRSKLCQASIQRMVPELERIARDCVCAPPLV